MKPYDWYVKNWRKLAPNELPKPGDAWFGGGPAASFPPKILDGDDCFDPVGMQDKAIFRKKSDKKVEFFP